MGRNTASATGHEPEREPRGHAVGHDARAVHVAAVAVEVDADGVADPPGEDGRATPPLHLRPPAAPPRPRPNPRAVVVVDGRGRGRASPLEGVNERPVAADVRNDGSPPPDRRDIDTRTDVRPPAGGRHSGASTLRGLCSGSLVRPTSHPSGGLPRAAPPESSQRSLPRSLSQLGTPSPSARGCGPGDNRVSRALDPRGRRKGRRKEGPQGRKEARGGRVDPGGGPRVRVTTEARGQTRIDPAPHVAGGGTSDRRKKRLQQAARSVKGEMGERRNSSLVLGLRRKKI